MNKNTWSNYNILYKNFTLDPKIQIGYKDISRK